MLSNFPANFFKTVDRIFEQCYSSFKSDARPGGRSQKKEETAMAAFVNGKRAYEYNCMNAFLNADKECVCCCCACCCGSRLLPPDHKCHREMLSEHPE